MTTPSDGLRVTEVVVRPVGTDGRLVAFANIVLGGAFVVRGLKLIRADGRMFVAMPSFKAARECPGCPRRPDFDAAFCPDCGTPLPLFDAGPEVSLHHDHCHPTNAEVRAAIEDAVVAEYERLQALQSPPPLSASPPAGAPLAARLKRLAIPA